MTLKLNQRDPNKQKLKNNKQLLLYANTLLAYYTAAHKIEDVLYKKYIKDQRTLKKSMRKFVFINKVFLIRTSYICKYEKDVKLYLTVKN